MSFLWYSENSFFALRDAAATGEALNTTMRCKVVDAAVQRGHLGVIRFGDFYFEFLVKPNDEVQEVHGIDVELVANSQFRLNLRQVGLRSNLTKDDP